ncbi:MAG: XdhC family protein [Opitutaceae bacterium]|nr:XdhC family protein [Opitutaceae bacterium]
MSELAAIVEALSRARETPAVLATLISVEGSSYRRPGARLLLLPDGTHLGSISGGCLEEDLKAHGRRVLATGRAMVVEYDTTAENDLVWGVGLGCQGVVRVFLERIPALSPPWVGTLRSNRAERRATVLVVDHGGADPTGTQLATEGAAVPSECGRFVETIPAPPALVVFGAGDDARPLAVFAKALGWHLTVADARGAYATPGRFPEADRLIVAPAAALAEGLVLDGRSYAVVMTHRYADDLALLRTLLPGDAAYLGLLGPRKRTARLLAQLQAEGFVPDAAMLAKLHAPVGLDLGGDTPETVALAIVSEVQARLAGKNPGFLRERPGPIHG